MSKHDFPNTETDHPNPSKPTEPTDPMQEILPCLFQALIAALPVFIQSFFSCISGREPPAAGYKPGDRPRCQ